MILDKCSSFKFGKYNLEIGRKKYVMGILNVTPDSFSDGGKWLDPDLAVERAIQIQAQGADILDIGAQSTRPGYLKVSPDAEWKRLEPVLKKLYGKIKIPVSVDTFYPEIAEKSLNLGVDIINDVTGFTDSKMVEIVSYSSCGVIVMHSGKISNMRDFFERQINLFEKTRINTDRICLDPGIGFGKTYEENLFILANINKFKVKSKAFLVGASRKKVISASCDSLGLEDRLAGTICAHLLALLQGTDIVRVHDVKEAVQSIKILEKIVNYRDKKFELNQNQEGAALCSIK